jgi:hypothetical protein
MPSSAFGSSADHRRERRDLSGQHGNETEADRITA